MKKIYLLVLIASINLGCKNSPAKLSFFQNMNQYTKFDSIENKSILLGFDKVILKGTNRDKNNIPCYQLSTYENGVFNINGLIWLKDSIVYVDTYEDQCSDKTNDQVLFSFKCKDSTWSVCYDRRGFSTNLNVSKQGRYFNPQLKDSLTIFRIEKHVKNTSWSTIYFVDVSVKYGFVKVFYWDREHEYFINFLPKQIIKIRRTKPSLYRLE